MHQDMLNRLFRLTDKCRRHQKRQRPLSATSERILGRPSTNNCKRHRSQLISVWLFCTPEPWSTSAWCSASCGGYLRRQKGQPSHYKNMADFRWRR